MVELRTSRHTALAAGYGKPQAFRPRPIVAALRLGSSVSCLAGPALLLGAMALLQAAAGDVSNGQAIHRSAVFAERQIVSSAAAGAYSVHAADLDGDGDADLLSASRDDHSIAWYQNDAGVFTARTISSTAEGAASVFAADVDGDGHLDVLSASPGDNKIAWYRNDGAEVPVFTLHTIDAASGSPRSVHAADLDGDGDMDVLSASLVDNRIAWYENDGAAVPVFTPHIVNASAIGAISVFAADLDGDGDLDVLSASTGDDKIAWYENDGARTPGFTLRTIGITDGAYAVHAADLDGDGDIDVLSASDNDNRIAWYENDGGTVPGFTAHTIGSTAPGAISVFTADLDGDGDPDVLSAFRASNTLTWFENDGAADPGFTPRTVGPAGEQPRSVFAADLDGDGKPEVLLASTLDHSISMYRNQGGQYALETFDETPDALSPAQVNVPVLRIDGLHRGRAGDHRVQLGRLTLLLETGDGSAPLTSAQANALIRELRVFRDSDGDGALNPDSDTPTAIVGTLKLHDGLLRVDLGNRDLNPPYGFGETATYFVTVSLMPNAGARTTNTFRISHLPSLASATDADSESPVVLEQEPGLPLASGILAPPNTQPTPFRFTDQSRVPRSSKRTSDTVTIRGIGAPAPISVTGGGGRYSVGCTGVFTSAPTTVVNEQTVCVRHTASSRFDTAVHTRLTVGGVTDIFSSRTLPPPTLSIDDVSVIEGRRGVRLASFTVSLSEKSATPVTVDFATTNERARSGSDYVARSGTLSFKAGETRRIVDIAVKGDTRSELNETFLVRLFNSSGATLADSQGKGTIRNDD
ncbi:MAG: FG-GAP-like repeat-containing protein [Panacagrimonas sp.]